MASSPVGVMVSTNGGRPWSFLVNPSALSFSNNSKTNDSVFSIPVPIIREQKPAFQVHINKSEYVTRRMHTNVRVASFPGMSEKSDGKGGAENEAIVGVIL